MGDSNHITKNLKIVPESEKCYEGITTTMLIAIITIQLLPRARHCVYVPLELTHPMKGFYYFINEETRPRVTETIRDRAKT